MFSCMHFHVDLEPWCTLSTHMLARNGKEIGVSMALLSHPRSSCSRLKEGELKRS